MPTTAADSAHAARNVASEPVALPVADGADGLDLFSVLKAAQAITRRILDLHGCTIDLASSPGHGSCFAFTLPAQNRPS